MTIKFWGLALFPSIAFCLSYNVTFIGVDDPSLLKALKNTSELVAWQKKEPRSLYALKSRVADDVPNLIKTLHAFSYYDGAIQAQVELTANLAHVYLFVRSGAPYELKSYEIVYDDCRKPLKIPKIPEITPQDLGLQLGHVATSTQIINAEQKLLTYLAKKSYPLATVDRRKVIVDTANQSIDAAVCVQPGPLTYFGPTFLYGIQKTDPAFILPKLGWKEGQEYNSDFVEKTQDRLLKTGLFSSVYISHKESLDSEGKLPMQIRFTESKYSYIHLGLFYATVDGIGGSFGWTRRNLRGKGQSISANGEFSKRFLLGNIVYKIPDFWVQDQTYRLTGEISKTKIIAYHAFIYRATQYLERQFSKKDTFSIGAKVENINVSDSANSGVFTVLGLPLFFRHQQIDDFFNPTKGYCVVYSITPYQSLKHLPHHFFKQRLTGNLFFPIPFSKRLPSTLAISMQLGSICGTGRENIPLTKLFLGGSEDNLRGYRYKTVSPLDDGKILGGRSAIFNSVELRLRLSEQIGLVPFFDFGTVTSSVFPKVDTKWRKSIGIGARYFAFFGPFRLDLGFPLDRREGLDHRFQIYVSVGQSF